MNDEKKILCLIAAAEEAQAALAQLTKSADSRITNAESRLTNALDDYATRTQKKSAINILLLIAAAIICSVISVVAIRITTSADIKNAAELRREIALMTEARDALIAETTGAKIGEVQGLGKVILVPPGSQLTRLTDGWYAVTR